MTIENKYRQKSRRFIDEISMARAYLLDHKPSIGYVGEHLLYHTLKKMLPAEYGICQGFVRDIGHKNMILSRQCDIIIYKKENAIYKSFSDIKIINSDRVCAVIEVKSSLQEKTFHTTLDAFERLSSFGVKDKFLFVYNCITQKNISKWLYLYRCKNKNIETIVSDAYLYDWPDRDWLPNSIISLGSESLYSQSLISSDDDWFGYVSYSFFEKEDMAVSCLQEFLTSILRLVDESTPDINFEYMTINKAIQLFR